MNVTRFAMAGLMAALAAGCTGPPDGAAPNATTHEPVEIGSGTTPPPAASRTSATDGTAAGARLPAVPPPRPTRSATESGSDREDRPPEPPPPGERDIASEGPDVHAEPAMNGVGRAAPVGAPIEEPEGASTEANNALTMLRDRSAGPATGFPRGGSDSPDRAFSRSTIDDCTVIRRLGDAMALSRSRGAPESEAVRDGVDRLVGDFGLPRDDRTKFTGRVYGILVYRLEQTHTVQALASYAHAVCRVYLKTNQIIPVDAASERAINDRLRACDDTTAVREELEDCILRGLLEIVARAP